MPSLAPEKQIWASFTLNLLDNFKILPNFGRPSNNTVIAVSHSIIHTYIQYTMKPLNIR